MRKHGVRMPGALCLLVPAMALAGEGRAVPLLGSGGWRPDTAAVRPLDDAGRTRPASLPAWQVEALELDGGTVLGRVRLSGSRMAREGNLEGRRHGSEVWGTVRDDQGAVLFRFSGRVSGRGLSGTYEDRTGERGRWAWEGEMPKQGAGR